MTEQLLSYTKVIPKFENYRIGPDGSVWSCYKYKTSIPSDVWREVKPVIDSGTGYPLVTLCANGVRKNKHIHRLVAEAFLPNPERKPQVNHIDGVKKNSYLSNLEWVTHEENAKHAVEMGLCEERRLLTARRVIQLTPDTLSVIAEYDSLHDAGRDTGIAWQNIWKVCDGRRKRAGGFSWQYL